MKKTEWIVGKEGVRPAGSPNHCFYCGCKVGTMHKTGCVIVKKTILMEMKVEILVTVPEDWDKDMCEFHKNESSWWASNIIETLKEIDEVDPNGCVCWATKFKFIREATKDDEENYGIYVDKLEG